MNNIVVLDPKCTKHYYCEFCEYKTDNKSNWNKHILTRKHKFKQNEQNLNNVQLTLCKYCDKHFKSRSGLWYHEKKCKIAHLKMICTTLKKDKAKSLSDVHTEAVKP